MRKMISPNLKSHGFYCKIDNQKIQCAYLYICRIDGDFTTLMLFNSSDSENCDVYRTYDSSAENRTQSQRMIHNFLAEVEESGDQRLDRNQLWHLCRMPEMVLDKRLVKRVCDELLALKQLIKDEFISKTNALLINKTH